MITNPNCAPALGLLKGMAVFCSSLSSSSVTLKLIASLTSPLFAWHSLREASQDPPTFDVSLIKPASPLRVSLLESYVTIRPRSSPPSHLVKSLLPPPPPIHFVPLDPSQNLPPWPQILHSQRLPELSASSPSAIFSLRATIRIFKLPDSFLGSAFGFISSSDQKRREGYTATHTHRCTS